MNIITKTIPGGKENSIHIQILNINTIVFLWIFDNDLKEQRKACHDTYLVRQEIAYHRSSMKLYRYYDVRTFQT